MSAGHLTARAPDTCPRRRFWPGGGLAGALFTAFAGAVVLLFLIGLIRKA